MNVIFHLNQIERLNHCIANIRNLSSRNIEKLELLINGDAITLLVSEDQSLFKQLLEQKVDVVACQNSLNAHHIHADELCEGIRIVPTGVYELIEKQTEGYAYIKP
ncbi:DsrE family protein [Erysipelothrix rhusiopathiae]|nr:DsrE family protein [Erysipelothrix rhusiopathiae]